MSSLTDFLSETVDVVLGLEHLTEIVALKFSYTSGKVLHAVLWCSEINYDYNSGRFKVRHFEATNFEVIKFAKWSNKVKNMFGKVR